MSTPTTVIEVAFVRPVMTRAEAADYMRVSVKQLDNWVGAGLVRSSKVGRSVRIRKEWLDEFLDENAEGSVEEVAQKLLSAIHK